MLDLDSHHSKMYCCDTALLTAHCVFLEPPLHSWHIAGGGRRELSFITLVNMVEILFLHAVQHANQAHHTANYLSCAVNPFSTRCFHVA